MNEKVKIDKRGLHITLESGGILSLDNKDTKETIIKKLKNLGLNKEEINEFFMKKHP